MVDRAATSADVNSGATKSNNMANDEGAAVTRTTQSDRNTGLYLFYCARTLGTETIPGSDGQCGPSDGPQCHSCKCFQKKAPPPLHIAAHFGLHDVVSGLLVKGANIEAVDKDGMTPLDHAMYNNHDDTAAILKQAGGKRASDL
eukprot:gene29420-5768_t